MNKEYHARKSKEWYQERKEDTAWVKDRNLYRTQARRNKKAEAVEAFGRICHHCTQSFPDCVFDFHHLNYNEKDIKPSQLFMLSTQKIQTELAKCIMLCANCHRLEHERLGYDAHEQRDLNKKYA